MESNKSRALRVVEFSKVFSLQVLQMEPLTLKDKNLPRQPKRVNCQNSILSSMKSFKGLFINDTYIKYMNVEQMLIIFVDGR